MKVLRGDPRAWSAAPAGGSAVTIGVYDGVHTGHQAVLADLERQATVLGVASRAVLTFDQHPVSVLAPERTPKLLGTLEQRLEILEGLGIDIVGVLPFERIREMHPAEFIHQVLIAGLGARLVVVGTNFRFGMDRAGDVETLRGEGARHGFEVDAVELLRGESTAVSSTVIRALLAEGNVTAAEEALGRPFELRGMVAAGDGRGRSVGFPTANLSFLDELMVPAKGVYAGEAAMGATSQPAVINVGVRPTFGGKVLTVEAHLLDFEGDLYGRSIAIRFKCRLRNEIRFESIDELAAQIGEDVAAARRLLGPDEEAGNDE